jgi:murein DD-endopeptidase MepM/ murein hydrolase activator NlpD
MRVKSTGRTADTSFMIAPSRSGPALRRARSAVAAVLVCVGAVWAGSLVQAQAAGAPASLTEPGSALVQAERLRLRTPPGMLPFPVDAGSDCYVLDNFGDGRSGGTRLHEGVDIMGSAGRAVTAVVDGTLTKRYTNTGTAGWGWTLYDGATDITYKYFHLTADPNGLVQGARVSRGDVIGYVGSSGTSSPDNFHLHFEVRPANVAVDPLPLLYIEPTGCGVSPPIR